MPPLKYSRDNVLFIQGPEKTGTSSLNGMLNAHPQIMNLFEVYMAQSSITKYGHQLLDKYPSGRMYFREDDDYGAPYIDFFNHFSTLEPDFSYTFIGTKINSMVAGLTTRKYPYKTIYTIRDVRSWAIKQSVIKHYRTELDIVIPIMAYLRFVVESYKYPDILKIWMEDMVLNNNHTFDRIGDYLELDFSSYKSGWWEMFGAHSETDPKSTFRLSHIHHSSQIKPERLDTSYKLADHPFWNEVSEIFDKYYLKNDEGALSDAIMAQDLQRIERLHTYAPLTIEDAYIGIKTERFGDLKSEKIEFDKSNSILPENESLMARIIRRLHRINQAARGKTILD